jgi:hypothetical protein
MADLDLESLQKRDQIEAEAPKAFEQLTPALQSLMHLTRLEYSHHVPVRQAAVQPLPASLVTLQLGQSDDMSAFLAVVRKGGLSLSHLTRLTHLTMASIQPADVLPPSLVSLRVPKCVSLEPALDLQQLQKLQLGSVPPAAELAQLAALRSLQELHLEAATHEMSEPQTALTQAAAHLPILPLKSLVLHMFEIEPAFMESLSGCTGLIKLHLQYPLFATALGKFGAALRQLTALEQLTMSQPELEEPRVMGPVRAVEAGMRAMLQAIVALPSLRRVELEGWWLSDGLAGELAAATQLKELMVCDCGVEPEDVELLVEKLEPAGVELCIGD